MLQKEKERMIREIMATMSPEQRYKFHFEEMYAVCKEQEWGDPFSYARSKEIYAAIELGHRIAPRFDGPDSYDENGEPCEFKSTTGARPKGAYTGISVQDSWSKQDRYLKNEKIACYPKHYMIRFDGGKLVEAWVLSGKKVYDLLLPKLKKKYPTVLSKKDPRLSANITTTEIHRWGEQVISVSK